MEYRIVIETELSSKKRYYVQKRFLFFFWCYLRQVRDMSMYAYKIEFTSLEEAERGVFLNLNTIKINKQSKVVKREYVVIK